MTSEPMTSDQPAQNKDELITLAEVSDRYGFSRGYLRELAARGRLKARKLGNIWVTTPADVEEYIASRERRGAYREDIDVENNT